MKDQIKKILQDYFDAVDAKFIDGHVSIEFDDLATRLDKAIGIDEEKVLETILTCDTSNHVLGGVAQTSYTTDELIAKAITQSRPLKCEVGE